LQRREAARTKNVQRNTSRIFPVFIHNRVTYTDVLFIRVSNTVGARSAQVLAKPTRTKDPSATDRRLRADGEPIRTQATIIVKPLFPNIE
jgi:hypothetical protein